MNTIMGKRLRDFALDSHYRSDKWKKHIRSLDCLFHPGQASEPHHFLGSTMGLKSSDIFTVPLCRECHNAWEPRGDNDELIEYWAKIAHEFIEKTLQNGRVA